MPLDLSTLEARVLGVLVEKQRAVPDIYPLSLNALTAGCNQKTSRDPIMEVTEAEVQTAVDALRSASLPVAASSMTKPAPRSTRVIVYRLASLSSTTRSVAVRPLLSSLR